MRERWKQAGLIFLSLLAAFIALNACGFLLGKTGIRSFMLTYIIATAAVLAAYLAAAKWIERRAPIELSLQRALPVLAGSLLGGIALFSLVMTVLWIVRAYQPQAWNSADGLALAFLFWLAVAVQEEILYRGLLFRLCSKLAGTWGALVLSAAFFGATHAFNAGSTPAGVASVMLAGIMLGAGYVASGRLWLPIGLHAGWNFAEGSLFGTAVSGTGVDVGLVAGKLSGPAILTGGNFGPEASIVAVVVLLPPTAYFLWRIMKLRRSEPPVWNAGLALPAAQPVSNAP